jgi:hypothetical protein
VSGFRSLKDAGRRLFEAGSEKAQRHELAQVGSMVGRNDDDAMGRPRLVDRAKLMTDGDGIFPEKPAADSRVSPRLLEVNPVPRYVTDEQVLATATGQDVDELAPGRVARSRPDGNTGSDASGG